MEENHGGMFRAVRKTVTKDMFSDKTAGKPQAKTKPKIRNLKEHASLLQ